jgi:hypothetical protein
MSETPSPSNPEPVPVDETAAVKSLVPPGVLRAFEREEAQKVAVERETGSLEAEASSPTTAAEHDARVDGLKAQCERFRRALIDRLQCEAAAEKSGSVAITGHNSRMILGEYTLAHRRYEAAVRARSRFLANKKVEDEIAEAHRFWGAANAEDPPAEHIRRQLAYAKLRLAAGQTRPSEVRILEERLADLGG